MSFLTQTKIRFCGENRGCNRYAAGAKALIRGVVLWAISWQVAFCPAGTALGGIIHLDFTRRDPATQERVEAALDRLEKSPSEISAMETLLAVDPEIVEKVGTNESFSSSDPVLSRALVWCQSLQPAEVLATCLDKGSDAAARWALRQIGWGRHNDGFGKEDLARLKPGVDKALVRADPATRAQAVRTMLYFLPPGESKGFLKGMLTGQPEEVVAAAVEEFTSLRQSDPEFERIVGKWLATSDNPLLLNAGCNYWWLVKGRSMPMPGEVKEEEIAAFERLAGHRDAAVRCSVTRAVEGVATPARPRLVAVLLQLTHDQDSMVSWNATRALRNANSARVNARLRDLSAAAQPENLRAAAVEVLGIFGKDNLPLILRAASTDKAPLVRTTAIDALRTIGTSAAGKGLEAASHDPDKTVRTEALIQWGWFQKEHPAKR